jgi:hypothetical protein
MTNPSVAKWTAWLDQGPIWHNILTMHLQRHVWREMTEIVTSRGDLPESYWWAFQVQTYRATQATAIRRQADRDPRSASLANLLSGMADNAASITREWWLSLWNDDDQFYAAEQWTADYGREVETHIDPAIPAADLERLKSAVTHVKNYVDKHVAHSDAKAVSVQVTLTLGDLHAAIDVLGQIFLRYHHLLTGSTMAYLVPTLQHDWKAVFRVPWIEPEPIC